MITIPTPQAPLLLSQEGNKASFAIEGLYPGYGITLANALRRVILSSLPGASVIAFKIKDVDHEFSTIPGVMEDVISVMLNIKKMRFKVFEEGYFEGKLKVKAVKEIRAGDFTFPSEVEIVNPDLPIATITDKKEEIEMSVWISQGTGYELSKEHVFPPSIPSVGVIKVDSIFTPVLAASFKVENMRVGERTDYNRISFDVETDGTISPKEALEKSIETLIDQFSALKEVERQKQEKQEKEEKAKKIAQKEKGISLSEGKEEKAGIKEPSLSGRYLISHLKLSSRIEKILKKHRVKTIGQLAKQREERLMEIDGIGDAAVKEIRRKLGKAGFLLGTK